MIAFADPAIAGGVLGLAAGHATGRWTPAAVTRTYLDRIARYDALNAFIDVDAERAMAAARASGERWAAGRPLSPLDGVPVAVKGNIAVAGLPWTAGIGAYRGRIAGADAPCVATLRNAGLVILGTLNLHEGALGVTSDNPWFGRVGNPYRPDHVPGGSSGGSGAAVAAGLCAAALGTDTLGSVRIPAAHCGVVGLKPRFGAIDTTDVTPLALAFDHVGVIARSVADAAAILGLYESVAPSPPERIGVFVPAALDPATAAALDLVCERLAAAGLPPAPVDFAGYDFSAMRRAALILAEVDAAAAHHAALAADLSGFSPEFRQMLAFGASLPPDKLTRAQQTVAAGLAEVRTAMTGADALVLPVTATPAFTFAQGAPTDHADLTSFAAMLGWPAIAVPVTLSTDGVPIGVQVVSRDGGKAIDLATMVAGLVPGIPAPVGYRG